MKKGYNSPFLKAVRYFVDSPYDEIYLREFGRKVGISPNSAQRFLNLLLNEGFIVESKRGNLRYFKANIDSVSFRQLKILFSLRTIENSGMFGYLKGKNVSSFILFGSVAKGLDSRESDIDVVCLGPEKNIDLHVFEKKLDRELQIHLFTWAEWKKQAKQNRAFYLDVIKDGIP